MDSTLETISRRLAASVPTDCPACARLTLSKTFSPAASVKHSIPLIFPGNRPSAKAPESAARVDSSFGARIGHTSVGTRTDDDDWKYPIAGFGGVPDGRTAHCARLRYPNGGEAWV